MEEVEYKCQTCLYQYAREGRKDLSKHCKACGLFRKTVDGFVKSYPATLEGSIRWMDNFARRRDAAEEIVISGVPIHRKVMVSISDHYSMASVASTTYYAFSPNRSYVEDLLKVRRIS